MIQSEEIQFYNLIKNNCNIIFDIGCREDIDYIKISPLKEFHLFEPNPIFYKKCKEKLGVFNKKIFLNNYGLGNKTESIGYYNDSQSFIKRKTHFISKSKPVLLKIVEFSEYLNKNNISKIDFIKIDTEGFEPNILTNNIKFIKNNVQYVQFEYASTWLDNKDCLDLSEIIDIYNNEYDFYFLLDKNHPISKYTSKLLNKIITKKQIDIINYYMKHAYGFNIVMIRK